MKQFLINSLAKALGVSKAILSFFIPIFQSSVSVALTQLLPIALKIVTELALSNNLGNAEKRSAAVSQLEKEAILQGITCSVSILNATVENAVLLMKVNDSTK